MVVVVVGGVVGAAAAAGGVVAVAADAIPALDCVLVVATLDIHIDPDLGIADYFVIDLAVVNSAGDQV